MNNDYNTSRKRLILPEYGRSVHKMVDHTINIEDKEERNKAAKTLISIMGNLNPQLRDFSDYKHKLWDHLAIISDFKLDVDSPFEKPEPGKFAEKPKQLLYTQESIKYKHYGKYIEMMVKKATEMEEGEEKNFLIKMLANHMKKSYLTWNRENVSDEQIFSDLRELSNSKINLQTSDFKLSETRDILQKNRNKKRTQRKNK